jgi:hypothetical protein
MARQTEETAAIVGVEEVEQGGGVEEGALDVVLVEEGALDVVLVGDTMGLVEDTITITMTITSIVDVDVDTITQIVITQIVIVDVVITTTEAVAGVEAFLMTQAVQEENLSTISKPDTLRLRLSHQLKALTQGFLIPLLPDLLLPRLQNPQPLPNPHSLHCTINSTQLFKVQERKEPQMDTLKGRYHMSLH